MIEPDRRRRTFEGRHLTRRPILLLAATGDLDPGLNDRLPSLRLRRLDRYLGLGSLRGRSVSEVAFYADTGRLRQVFGRDRLYPSYTDDAAPTCFLSLAI